MSLRVSLPWFGAPRKRRRTRQQPKTWRQSLHAPSAPGFRGGLGCNLTRILTVQPLAPENLDFGHPLVVVAECVGVLGQQSDDEGVRVVFEVLHQRRDALGIYRLQGVQ